MNAEKEPTYGLHRKKQMPLFHVCSKKEIFGDAALDDDGISSLVALTQQVFADVERELKLTGFWESIPARNKLKADIQKTLLQPEFSELPGLVQNRAHIISRVMEIAEKKQRRNSVRAMRELNYKIVHAPPTARKNLTTSRSSETDPSSFMPRRDTDCTRYSE